MEEAVGCPVSIRHMPDRCILPTRAGICNETVRNSSRWKPLRLSAFHRLLLIPTSQTPYHPSSSTFRIRAAMSFLASGFMAKPLIP